MSTATQQLTRLIEACVWQLRPRVRLALEELTWGFFFVYCIFGNGGLKAWLGFGAVTFTWIGMAYLGRRHLPFSDRLQHRWLIETELNRRFDSYRFRNHIWAGVGAAVGVLVTGAPYMSFTIALMYFILGLVAAYRWQQLGIDEQNYQPA
jgi:hypothetical protein